MFCPWQKLEMLQNKDDSNKKKLVDKTEREKICFPKAMYMQLAFNVVLFRSQNSKIIGFII